LRVETIDMAYPTELAADVATDIGTVHIRPIRPDDAERLVAFHESLSPDSQYLRFFNAHPHLSGKEVDRFTHVDYSDRLALVAELDRTLIAVGRYDRLGGTTEAEVAFVVADAYQCHGLGTLLLHRLASAAAARGITRFSADTLAGNRRMQAVFRESGYPVHAGFEDGVVKIAFAIVPVAVP
jgi:GNAT superfamily N-acetyltransferase